jgi:large subunit ribosomal protein L6
MPVEVPQGVDVKLEGDTLTVKGAKTTLSTHVPTELVKFQVADGVVTVEAAKDTPESSAAAGLVRTLAANLVTGVTDGFKKELVFKGVGYRAAVEGDTLKLNVGYSHPVELKLPEGVSAEVKKTTITISGADRQAVGQFAANVRAVRPPEPYKGKGIAYADEHIRRKAGKAGKAGGE